MAPYQHARDGQRLRAARIAAGLRTQQDLARILGTTRERVSGWEIGRVRVSDDYRAKIEDVLGLDLDDGTGELTPATDLDARVRTLEAINKRILQLVEEIQAELRRWRQSPEPG